MKQTMGLMLTEIKQATEKNAGADSDEETETPETPAQLTCENDCGYFEFSQEDVCVPNDSTPKVKNFCNNSCQIDRGSRCIPMSSQSGEGGADSDEETEKPKTPAYDRKFEGFINPDRRHQNPFCRECCCQNKSNKSFFWQNSRDCGNPWDGGSNHGKHNAPKAVCDACQENARCSGGGAERAGGDVPTAAEINLRDNKTIMRKFVSDKPEYAQ
jgi:hypothetical protein